MAVLRTLSLAFFATSSASAIPADVLCNSKLLAYDFAQQLMPERSHGTHRASPVKCVVQ
jgi:hypothetical protein